MAHIIREDRFHPASLRADEIRIHHQEWWRTAWPLLLLAGLLTVGLMLWAYQRNRTHIATVEAPVAAPEAARPVLPPLPEKPKVLITPPELPSFKAPEAALPEEPKPAQPPAASAPRAPVVPFQRKPVVAAKATCEDASFAFATNKVSLGETQRMAIAKVNRCLYDNPNVTLNIIGQADPAEEARFGKGMARARAQAVADALRDRGIPMKRLRIEARTATCSMGDKACWSKDRLVRVVPGS